MGNTCSCVKLKRRKVGGRNEVNYNNNNDVRFSELGQESPYFSATTPKVPKGFIVKMPASRPNLPTVMVTYATPLSRLPLEHKTYLESINVLEGRRIPVGEQNIGEYVLNGLHKIPTLLPLLNFGGHSFDKKEVLVLVSRAVEILTGLRLEPGTRLLCISDICWELPPLAIAANLLQLPLALLNPKLVKDEKIVNDIKSLSIEVILVGTNYLDEAFVLVKKLQSPKKMYLFGSLEPIRGVVPFFSLAASAPDLLPQKNNNNNNGEEVSWKASVAFVMWTQGRNAAPRPVHLTHASLFSAVAHEHFARVVGGQKVLGLLPHYHPFGFTVQLYPCLTQGASLYFLPFLSPHSLLGVLEANEISVCLAVTPVVEFLAESPSVDGAKLASLRDILCTLSPLSRHTMELLYRRFPNLLLHHGYGLCETGALTHCTKGSRVCSESVGALLPNLSCKIVHLERSVSVVARKGGEVCVRGPQVSPFMTQDSSQQSFVDSDGWLHTGDLGYYDERHNLFICGIANRMEPQSQASQLRKVGMVRNVGMTPFAKRKRLESGRSARSEDDSVFFSSISQES